MNFKISVNIKPVSLNVILRMHWKTRSDMQQIYDLYIMKEKNELPKEIKQLFPLKKVNFVKIIYYFKDKKHRDYDNYSGKFIFDALKHNEIIIDDNCNIIQSVQYQIILGAKDDYFDIIIDF